VTLVYQLLTDYLTGRHEDELSLSFSDLEGILGVPLPRGAYTAGWWSNRGRTPQGRAWQEAGWRVQKQQVRRRTVSFMREPGGQG